MLTVNLLDAAFSHLPGSSVHGKTARRIRYERGHLKWPGITLITDAMLTDSNVLDVLESKHRIGWLMEPREYKPEGYAIAAKLLPRLDLLLTHDQALIDKYPEKVRFVPFGGCWIQSFLAPPKAIVMDGFQPRVSHIYSGKRFMQGHRLRHRIAEEIHYPWLDLYGRGTAHPVERKEEALSVYGFSVVVENSRARNFFTEKLLDCFAVGTVPIYWGAPNVGDFFDMRGIVTFESIEELPAILADLDYDRHLEGIKENFARFRQYEITDDWISEHVLEAM